MVQRPASCCAAWADEPTRVAQWQWTVGDAPCTRRGALRPGPRFWRPPSTSSVSQGCPRSRWPQLRGIGLQWLLDPDAVDLDHVGRTVAAQWRRALGTSAAAHPVGRGRGRACRWPDGSRSAGGRRRRGREEGSSPDAEAEPERHHDARAAPGPAAAGQGRPPTGSKIASTGSVRAAGSATTCTPRARRSAWWRGEAVPCTRTPSSWASSTRADPTPPAAPSTRTDRPGCTRAAQQQLPRLLHRTNPA